MDLLKPEFWISVEGRIGRIKYLAAAVFLAAPVALILWAGQNVGGVAAYGLSLLGVAFYSIGVASLTIRRAHDFDASGWLALLIFVPVANLAFYLWPGTNGTNRYGPPPANDPPLMYVLASLALLPFLAALLFVVIGSTGTWSYKLYCNDPSHKLGSVYPGLNECSQVANSHFDEFKGQPCSEGCKHSVGCKVTDAPFPWSLTIPK